MNYSANIDTAEIEKFSAMAQDWWNTSGPCAPLHVLNSCRLQFLQQHTVINDKDILDVGCGGGIFAESLANLKANVTGIDACSDVITVAKSHAALSKLSIQYCSITIEDFLKTSHKQFDIITCMELIEHVPNPGQLISNCAQLLKPGGHLFISTINRTIKAYGLAIIGAEYILKILPKQTHDYKKFIRPAELAMILQKSQMTLQDIQGIKYNPFTKKACLQGDVSVNYLIHAIKGI